MVMLLPEQRLSLIPANACRLTGGCFASKVRSRKLPAHRRYAWAASYQNQQTATSSRSKTSPPQSVQSANGFQLEVVCPICLQTPFQVDVSAGPTYRKFPCARCQRTFISSKGIPDLTLTSGIDPGVYQSETFARTEIFRSPVVSYIYERGWRQGFRSAGFPGADEEFRMSMDFLQPAYSKVLLDLSCGSGLFTRRFVASSKFQGVIAADFSESMLQQTRKLFSEDSLLDSRHSFAFNGMKHTRVCNANAALLLHECFRSICQRQLGLVRVDVARMPFETGSLAAIHAGAAIHCWPNPTAAMAEISRVLQPGGIFVASTFLKSFSPLGELLGDDAVRPLNQTCRCRRLNRGVMRKETLRRLTLVAEHSTTHDVKQRHLQMVGRARVAGFDGKHGLAELPEIQAQ